MSRLIFLIDQMGIFRKRLQHSEQIALTDQFMPGVLAEMDGAEIFLHDG